MYNFEKVLDQKYHRDLQVFFTADILTPLSRKSTAVAHSNAVVRHNSVSIWRLRWTRTWNSWKEFSRHSFFMFTCAFPAVTCHNVFNENSWLDCSRPAVAHLSTIFCLFASPFLLVLVLILGPSQYLYAAAPPVIGLIYARMQSPSIPTHR